MPSFFLKQMAQHVTASVDGVSAVDNRLIVKLRAPTTDAVETLSAYGNDVRSAIEQLGWSVDEVSYELAAPARAAQAVVDHVLSSGSVDQEL